VLNWRNEWDRAKALAQARGSRPFVTATFAVSRDGCLSGKQGEPTLISDQAAMEMTHALRALHDVVLVGVGTVLSDDPLLTTRLVAGPSPRRVVLDSMLRTPVTARVLTARGKAPLIVGTTAAEADRVNALREAGADVTLLEPSPDGVSLQALLSHLAGLGLGSVMVEGGATVLKSFFSGRWVDFVCVTESPLLLANPRAVRLDDTVSSTLAKWPAASVEQMGPDLIRAGPYAARQWAGKGLT
jgi:3,4-dihydroxy 2-butanone 4-phosphate synthase/GTP cyclohydrolase II